MQKFRGVAVCIVMHRYALSIDLYQACLSWAAVLSEFSFTVLSANDVQKWSGAIDTPSMTWRCTPLGWFGRLFVSTIILTSKPDHNPLQPEMWEPAAISQLGHSQGTPKTCANSSARRHRSFRHFFSWSLPVVRQLLPKSKWNIFGLL